MQKICIYQFGANYELESSTDTVYKLNTVSETINEISRTYNEESKRVANSEDSKEAFIDVLEEKLKNLKENVLYDDLIDEGNGLSSEIFEVLQDKNEVTKEDILALLEKRNEYIMGFDDFDTNMQIENDLNKVLRIINDTYKIGKINHLWKERMKENKKVIGAQLEGVSKAISSVANSINRKKETNFEEEKREIKMLCMQKEITLVDISIEQNKNGRYVVNTYINSCEDEEECRTYEIENILSKVLDAQIVLQKENCGIKINEKLCKQVYVSKDKFVIQIGIAEETKKYSDMSGDSNVQTRLDDGKYLVAISDGMGSGVEANNSSRTAVKMLNRMLSSGFDRDTSLELINSSMYINSKEDSYATLDVAILDLYTGNMEFMKNGACPTFIKNNKNVSVVKSISLPAGILDKVDLVVYDKDLEDGDIIVMCSDRNTRV